MKDIHAHVVPFLDDGPKSYEESLALMRMMEEQGITDVLATSHYVPSSKYVVDIDKIREYHQELMKKASEQGIRLNVALGMEIFYSRSIPRELKEGKIIPLNNTKVVLIELPMLAKPLEFDEVIYELSLDGYQVIIAHPERYAYYTNYQDIMALKKLGVFIQINASSFLGKYGKKVKKVVFKLLKKGYVDFIASDAHHPTHRPPRLAEVKVLLDKKIGSKNIDHIFHSNTDLLFPTF